MYTIILQSLPSKRLALISLVQGIAAYTYLGADEEIMFMLCVVQSKNGWYARLAQYWLALQHIMTDPSRDQ
jgi:hypothetical protein